MDSNEILPNSAPNFIAKNVTMEQVRKVVIMII